MHKVHPKTISGRSTQYYIIQLPGKVFHSVFVCVRTTNMLSNFPNHSPKPRITRKVKWNIIRWKFSHNNECKCVYIWLKYTGKSGSMHYIEQGKYEMPFFKKVEYS